MILPCLVYLFHAARVPRAAFLHSLSFFPTEKGLIMSKQNHWLVNLRNRLLLPRAGRQLPQGNRFRARASQFEGWKTVPYCQCRQVWAMRQCKSVPTLKAYTTGWRAGRLPTSNITHAIGSHTNTTRKPANSFGTAFEP